MSNLFNLCTSSANLTRTDGLWMVKVKGVITAKDIRKFIVDARSSINFGNFLVTDWREAVCAFTNAELREPPCETFVDQGGGGLKKYHFRFGASLGRPDQLPLLHEMANFHVQVQGNVRRVFTDHPECMRWSTKVSNFLDKEDQDNRQAKLFI